MHEAHHDAAHKGQHVLQAHRRQEWLDGQQCHQSPKRFREPLHTCVTLHQKVTAEEILVTSALIIELMLTCRAYASDTKEPRAMLTTP